MHPKNQITGRFILFVLLSVFLSMPVSEIIAGEQADSAAVPFNFGMDWNRFRYSDSLTYFEFSATLYRSLLNYLPDEKNTFSAQFMVTAEILEGDSVIARRQWINVNAVDSLTEILDNQRLYCVNNFVLKPGEYNFRMNISDPNAQGREATEMYPVQINDYKSDKLQLSDIQLATTIEKDTSKNLYVKNGYRIMPNSNSLYGIGLPILYCYMEIYNLASATTENGNKYKISYSILNKDGKVVKTLPPKEKLKPGASSVEVNGMNVVTLVSGAYTLAIEVEDMESGEKVSGQRKFYVYREDDFAEGGALFKSQEVATGEGSPGLDADRYDVMSEKDIDQEFEYGTYISTREERSTFKKLNLEGKRSFIKEFWAKRDQTPGTPDNEFKQDYLGRIDMANYHYKAAFREGWKSDRGRVLLVYGKPDEIERYPFSNENRPYEFWHYFSIQGGVIFIFVDRRNMGDMELVHSTARGELYDAEWTRWITSDGSTQ